MLSPFRILVLSSVTMVLPAAVAAQEPATKSFASWTATCNNIKSCVVIGTAQDDLFYVRIARAAGAPAPPEVKIVLAAEEPFNGSASAFRLTAVTGDVHAALAPIPAGYADGDASILSGAIAPGANSLALINAVRDATTLDYKVSTTRGSLDLTGLSAALRFIDAQQGRQGTPTALVARGMTPVGQVPPAPQPPTIEAAPSGSVTAIDKPSFSRAVIDMAAKVCDADVVKDQADGSAWRLGPDTILVAVPCSQGAYNLMSALYITGADGGSPRAVVLPRPVSQSDEGPNIVVNANFDLKTMQLTSLDKGRGLGDCGTAATWVWSGRSFALLNASELEACPGALSDDWPSLYTAKLK